jgi:cytoskeletal protein CcmA (bactofilin family)
MTHIGRSTVFSGELSTDEDLTIDGTVKGDVQVREATLTISEKGQVDHGYRPDRARPGGTRQGKPERRSRGHS